MKAKASVTAGVCVFDAKPHSEYLSVLGFTSIQPSLAHLAVGFVSDWKSVNGPSKEAVVQSVRLEHDWRRIGVNLESCMRGASPGLTRDLLEECEELLTTSGGQAAVSAYLLRAPLAHSGRLNEITKTALANGLGATASLLNEVGELQAPLRRLTSAWLGLPESLFAEIENGRVRVWGMAVEKLVVLKTLHASSYQAVEQPWAALVFESVSPSERRSLFGVARSVATALYPDHSAASTSQALNDPTKERVDSDWVGKDERPRVSRTRFESALKQVDAIAAAVSAGNDSKAVTFLEQLIATQLNQGEADHAIKSLCNIAQQSADMYRTDFEYRCLQLALEVKPYDSYVLIQFADHLKRVGRFDEALNVLERAFGLGDELVRQSSIADVYAQMGEFDKALDIYDELTATQSDDRIRGAKADVLRRWGRLEEASREYNHLIDQGFRTPRVLAGLAEVAKRQGHLTAALDLYREVLRGHLDERSALIYQAAIAHVLARMGKYAESYNYLDQVVQARPFALAVRVQRAAVAGLLGNAEEAINELPALGQTHAFDEWVTAYVKGLLLLMLHRYVDARHLLVAQLERGLLDRESGEIVRLGAAVAFLRSRSDVAQADRLLGLASDLGDLFGNSVRDALRYHVAVAEGREAEIRLLRSQLIEVEDTDIRALVVAIDRRDWNRAWQLEVRSVLRLAA